MFAETIPEPKPHDPRALNAYRHGLTGQVHILTQDDKVAYDKHCRGIHDAFAPSGAMEADLVQSIAEDRWRLKRAAAIESSIFAMGIEPGGIDSSHPEIEVALLQAKVWLSEGKNLQLLGLYEHRMQRRVEKNMDMLRQLQQERKAAVQQALEDAARIAEHADNRHEDYDPATEFPAGLLPPQFDFSKPEIARQVAHVCRLFKAGKPPSRA